MPALLDLMPPAGEEVRLTSALAMLLALDQESELLALILERAKGSWAQLRSAVDLRERVCRLDGWKLGGEIRNVHLSNEERIVLGREQGRFDLVVRFELDVKPCTLVIEAKVSAEGEHGRQLELYGRQLRDWERGPSGTPEANAALCLLLLRPLEAGAWNSDLRSIDHFAGCVLWSEITAKTEEMIARRAAGPKDAFALISTELKHRLEELSMTAADYADRLKSDHYPYPLLVDALEAVAREVGGGSALHKEPRGTEGAPWDAKERAYYCGYWWRLRDGHDEWASLRMEWQWLKNPSSASKADWIPDGQSSGYAFSVQLYVDSNNDPVHAWSGTDFFGSLKSIVDEVKSRIKDSQRHDGEPSLGAL